MPSAIVGPADSVKSGQDAAANLRSVTILEDDLEQWNLLHIRFDQLGFLPAHAWTKEACWTSLDSGCRVFILDVYHGDGREIEGLQALAQIKRLCPLAFCAIVTNQVDYPYIKERANSLRADFCELKSDANFDKLEQAVAHWYLRAKHGAGAAFVIERIRQLATEIQACLDGNDTEQAEEMLVQLELPLKEVLGTLPATDPLRVALWGALLNTVVQEPGRGLTAERWKIWANVLGRLAGEPEVDARLLLDVMAELRKAQFNTELPSFPKLAEAIG